MAQPTDTYSNWQLIRDLWRWLGKHRLPFVGASLLLLVSEVSWLYPTYALAQIVTALTKPGGVIDEHALWFFVSTWVAVSFFRYLSREFSKFVAYQIGELMQIETEQLAVKHMLSLDIAWHEQENVGNKMRKVYRGAGSVEQVLDQWIDSFLPTGVSLVGSISIIGRVDPFISAVIIVFLVTYVSLGVVLGRRITKAIDAVNQGEEDVGGLEFEAIGNVRTVRALGFGGAIARRIERLNEGLFDKIVARIAAWRTRDVAIDTCGQLFRIGLLAYVLQQILIGRYEAGFLVLVYNYMTQLWGDIGRVVDGAQRFMAARQAIARMASLLRVPVGIDARGTKPFPSKWKTLSLRNVSFAYGDRKVLDDISFEVKRGERIGIVGRSGAGKSTLFKLLLKEYDNYSGRIAIDNTSLHDIQRQSFVSRVAVVLQDTEVFNFPLKENVTIASTKKVGDAKLLNQALTIAHVTDFVGRLPDGIETMIGEKGVKLSGGERQRVGIARAVFKQPDILFMDEATSHLDSESEQKIQDSLHQVFKSVTAVVIAHRLSTIREMDRILVLEDGRLIEEGSFDALLKQKGRFHQLWQTQQF